MMALPLLVAALAACLNGRLVLAMAFGVFAVAHVWAGKPR